MSSKTRSTYTEAVPREFLPRGGSWSCLLRDLPAFTSTLVSQLRLFRLWEHILSPFCAQTHLDLQSAPTTDRTTCLKTSPMLVHCSVTPKGEKVQNGYVTGAHVGQEDELEVKEPVGAHLRGARCSRHCSAANPTPGSPEFVQDPSFSCV